MDGLPANDNTTKVLRQLWESLRNALGKQYLVSPLVFYARIFGNTSCMYVGWLVGYENDTTTPRSWDWAHQESEYTLSKC